MQHVRRGCLLKCPELSRKTKKPDVPPYTRLFAFCPDRWELSKSPSDISIGESQRGFSSSGFYLHFSKSPLAIYRWPISLASGFLGTTIQLIVVVTTDCGLDRKVTQNTLVLHPARF